jgi:hypothetical protein
MDLPALFDERISLIAGALKDCAAAFHRSVHREAVISSVRKKIAEEGVWAAEREWRAFTVTYVRIERTHEADKYQYHVEVKCQGQRYKCTSPDLERACFFVYVYCQLIDVGFNAVGAPWFEVRRKNPD